MTAAPGPYTYNTDFDRLEDADGYPIVTFGIGSYANDHTAELLAAAWDLREALAKLLDAHYCTCPIEAECKDMEIARAALAKASGEIP